MKDLNSGQLRLQAAERGYIEDLKCGKCMEAFSISSGLRRKELFWLWCERICGDMEGEEFDELLIEKNRYGAVWVHFAVRPKENRHKVAFINA